MNLEQTLETAVEHHRAGRLQEAEAGYRDVLRAKPDHAAALHLLGVLAHECGNHEAAAGLIEKAVILEPARPEYRGNLGSAWLALGRLEEAERAYRAAIALEPGLAAAHYNLGIVQLNRRNPEDAAQCYRQAALLEPGFAAAHADLGSVLMQLGRLDEAEESLRRALALDPGAAAAHSNLGNLLQRQGRLEESERCQRQAVALEPGLALAHSNLACTLLELGCLEEAEQSARRATALSPALFDAHFNLGNALLSQDRLQEAEASLRQALALDAQSASAHRALGNLLMERKRAGDAEGCYRQAVALDPGDAAACSALGAALAEQGRRREANDFFRRAAELEPDAFEPRLLACIGEIPVVNGTGAEIDDSRSRYAAALAALREDLRLDTPRSVMDAAEAVGKYLPFFLAYQGRNDRELQALYGDIVAGVMRAWLGLQRLPDPAPRAGARRIRIGVVSAFFRHHSVWDVLTRGMVLGLDRSRFELFGYHTARQSDAETRFAQERFEAFRQGPWPLRRWVERIREDAPDVLVYPEVGMDPMSTKLAALRLAPLQAAMWGHPETTGLPTLDYFLSGELLEPPDAQDHYRERLVPLPNLGCCFRPMPVAPAPLDLAALGIPPDEDCARFLSCQGLMKYLPEHDALYPRIARAVGHCCFVFVRSADPRDSVAAQFQRRIETAFSSAGLDARKFCVFVDLLPRDAFFGLMEKMDVYLDTLCFSGFTTAFQALQCALPIVTLESGLMRGRLASGLLRRLGLAETIAADPEQYVSIAAGLGRDRARRAALKARLACDAARLFNDPAPLRAMEHLFERRVVPEERIELS